MGSVVYLYGLYTDRLEEGEGRVADGEEGACVSGARGLWGILSLSDVEGV